MRYLLLSVSVLMFLRLPVQAATPTDKIIPLGKIDGWHVSALVAIVPMTPEQEGTPYPSACTVRVRYLLQAGGKRILTNIMDAGEGYRDEVHIYAVDFTGSGHKQLLVSAKLGGVYSNVYDLSGTHLQTLYSREEGREAILPRRKPDRRYDLEEEWPPLQWEDEDNLGEGRYVSSSNYIVRRLHWNGKAFVSYYPGPSRVVNLRDVPGSPGWKVRMTKRQFAK